VNATPCTIKRKACLLVIMDYFNEACFDSLPVLDRGVGVRYVSEFHESAASMWRRVDVLWNSFRERPDVSDIGMCFLLKNYADRTLLIGMSDLGYLLVLEPHSPFDQWFHKPVADDGKRVIFWMPQDKECSGQDLHSRANVEKIAEHWLEYNHIPSYIPEDYKFPWEFERVQTSPDPC
jgi:hypothetical protein